MKITRTRPKIISIIFSLILVAGIASAISCATDADPETSEPEAPTIPHAIPYSYMWQDCSYCHGKTGEKPCTGNPDNLTDIASCLGCHLPGGD